MTAGTGTRRVYEVRFGGCICFLQKDCWLYLRYGGQQACLRLTIPTDGKYGRPPPAYVRPCRKESEKDFAELRRLGEKWIGSHAEDRTSDGSRSGKG